MSNYKQRFQQDLKYCSDLCEDLLAVTVCLPFTIALHCWNDLADVLRDVPLSPRVSYYTWNIGRLLFNFPLYLLKGQITLLVLLPLAGLLATAPRRARQLYRFPLGHALQRFFFNPLLQLMIAFFIRIGAIVDPLVTLGLLLVPYWATFLPIRWLSRLSALGLMIWNLELLLNAAVVILPIIRPFSLMIQHFSWPIFAAIMLHSVIAWLEGVHGCISFKIAAQISRFVSYAQLKLAQRGWQIFNNQTDLMGTPVQDLPLETVFVSNSNHIFTLADLEGNVGLRGLQNYYDVPARLDRDDFFRLERHPRLGQFPQLQAYISAHQADYHSTSPIIATETLRLLNNLALALGAPHDEPNFAEHILLAKESFEAHLNSLSDGARANVCHINIKGGSDPSYQLDTALVRVYNGRMCKAAASTSIQETIERINSAGGQAPSETIENVFWQNRHATHWVNLAPAR